MAAHGCGGAAAARGVTPELARLLTVAESAAIAAGAVILRIYAEPFEIRGKRDASPVTLADSLAEEAIIAALQAEAPDIPIIAEEQAERDGVPTEAPPRYWLVDPLDGTREFIKRNGEFAVCIGLVEAGRPVLGVIHVPVQQLTYSAAGPGSCARLDGKGRREPIAARHPPPGGMVVTRSRSGRDDEPVDRFLESQGTVAREIRAGSALKFGLVAAGEADLYPRFGPTMEWDTAAGQAIVDGAGGSVSTLDGRPLRYGKPGFRNGDFIVRGRPA